MISPSERRPRPRFRGYAMRLVNGRIQTAHRVRAEQALGKPLPPGAEVHHVDHDINVSAGRLVICQNRAYHHLLHKRARVLHAGGNPNTDAICCKCQRVLPLTEFRKNRAQRAGRTADCRRCCDQRLAAWHARKAATA